MSHNNRLSKIKINNNLKWEKSIMLTPCIKAASGKAIGVISQMDMESL
jgi:hypothetical protein